MDAPAKPDLHSRIGYQGLLLGGFSTLATVLLVAGNLATQSAIQDRQQEDLRTSLDEVVPAERHDNDLLAHPLQLAGPQGRPVTVYRGTEGSEVSALAWEIGAQGFSGEIRLILGVAPNGKVLGVRVLSHAETPGLGDKIEAEKDPWILGFDGLSLGHPPPDRWAVKKDGGRFDSFSGATITPRGVVNGIKAGLEFFAAHRTELLAPPAITTAERE